MDLHHHKDPGNCKPATQQCSSKAIDLIAGSLKVSNTLVHAWICPFGEPTMIQGDHCLLGLDLDPDVLFENAIAPPAQLTQCRVNSCHAQKVTKFCKRVITQCNHHQLAERIVQLQTLLTLGLNQLAKLKCIDDQLTKILLQADCHCHPLNLDPWSPKLNQAYF